MNRLWQQRGLALPVVLALAALLLALVAVSLDSVKNRTRAGANLLGRIQAFHAADAVVRLCERRVLQERRAGMTTSSAVSPGLPQRWRSRDAFEGPAREALEPAARWSNTARAPQCLVERWPTHEQDPHVGYLITARGFGPNEQVQVWLQARIVIDETGRVVDRDWRTIAGRPF